MERATAAGVSAKYGKKVRKKLQVSLDRMRGIYVEPAHEATPPAVEKTPEPQATAKQHRKLPNSSGGVHQPPLPPPRLPPGSAPAMPKPEPPRPVAPAAAAGMQPAMPPAQGASRHQQQQGGAPWGKPPPPPPTQPKPAGIPPPPPGLPPYGSAMQPHAPANYAAAAAGPNAAPAPASPLFTQPQPASMGLLFGDTPAPGPPAPPSPFGLFGEHQPLGYEAVSPRNGGPSPHDGLFAGGAFFSANVHQEAAQSLGSGGFPGLDAYGSDGASLPVQFAGMDLGGQGPVPSPFPPGFGSQAQGHGAPLDTFIGQDLAAHVFGHDDGMPGAGHVEDPLQAVDAGGPLLSFDLMDELDGTPHSAQAAAARLPDDPGSLFRGTPGPPSMVTMPGGGQGAFRPLW